MRFDGSAVPGPEVSTLAGANPTGIDASVGDTYDEVLGEPTIGPHMTELISKDGPWPRP